MSLFLNSAPSRTVIIPHSITIPHSSSSVFFTILHEFPMLHFSRSAFIIILHALAVQHSCARHNFLYIRGWMQMVIGTKWFIFLKQIIQWNSIPVMVKPYDCYTMHNSTHSVHKRLLKVWRARLLRLWPSCYVSSPPLSEANCQHFPPPGGPGPPASKMYPFSTGSTHTPCPPSVTTPTFLHS